jgi:hypothetical protein
MADNGVTAARRRATTDASAAVVDAYRVELTDELHAKLVQAFRLGATATIAAGSVGLSTRRLYVWIDRGRRHLDADSDGLPRTKYARLAIECEEARHKGDIELLASVRAQTSGRQCRTCQGIGTVRRNEAGGRANDRTLIRCPGCRGKGFVRPPDGQLALELLGRRHYEDYGRKDRHRHEVTGEGGGPVRVDVRSRAVTMDVDLAVLSPAQLAALAFGGDEVSASTAAIASATRGRLPVRRPAVVAAEAGADGDVIDAEAPTVAATAAVAAPAGVGVFGALAEVEADA